MKEKILISVEEGVQAIEFLRRSSSIEFIEKVVLSCLACFDRKGKILVAGNGGSLCDAMHFAEELTGIYRHKRSALPAIALADPGHMSCVANDMGYEYVFSRALEALGKPEDLFIVLTTSGNSPNLVEAVIQAKKMGLITVGFLGKTGGKLTGMCDLEMIVRDFSYSDRIQEAHMTAIHIIIEQIENSLFFQEKVVETPSFCCNEH
jgi:D-sedoheptulose 7-phosphate isomerase